MNAYDQVYKAYTDSQKNDFWDAWGIVISPRVIHELKTGYAEHMTVYNTGIDIFEKIFGLVVIPYPLLDDEFCYIVDERLGRTILEGMERSKERADEYCRNYCIRNKKRMSKL